MRVLVLRKKRIFKRQESEMIVINDMEIEIVYVFRVGKKIRNRAGQFDVVLSLDFKEFFKEINLLKYLAVQGMDKIASRHGGVDRDVLEVQVDVLNEENIKNLIAFALNVRRVIVHSDIDPENFDFLCSEAGVSPEFAEGDFKENLVIVFGEELLIKHMPTKITYYDVLPVLPKESDAYFLPEMNMIFSEYIKENPQMRENVKIRELMSK